MSDDQPTLGYANLDGQLNIDAAGPRFTAVLQIAKPRVKEIAEVAIIVGLASLAMLILIRARPTPMIGFSLAGLFTLIPIYLLFAHLRLLLHFARRRPVLITADRNAFCWRVGAWSETVATQEVRGLHVFGIERSQAKTRFASIYIRVETPASKRFWRWLIGKTGFGFRLKVGGHDVEWLQSSENDASMQCLPARVP